jgi:polysaccharide biosynthesis/export protein
MRVIRFLSLLFVAVLGVSGCAQQPAPTRAYAPAASISGIDGFVYGAGAAQSPAAVAARAAYSAEPATGTVATTASIPNQQARASGYASAVMPNAPTYYGGYAHTYGDYAEAPNPYATTSVTSFAPAHTASPARPYGARVYPAAPAIHEQYTLDTGDRLRVVVFGQDGLTNSYVVGASGTIDMPLIGAVTARGVTAERLANLVREKLRDGFIREPHVAVQIEAYRPFFILGEVTAAGQYPYVANMTVETAIAIAGGFTPRAFRGNVIVSRNYYGQPQRMKVPLTFALQPGDTINVQERWF